MLASRARVCATHRTQNMHVYVFALRHENSSSDTLPGNPSFRGISDSGRPIPAHGNFSIIAPVQPG